MTITGVSGSAAREMAAFAKVVNEHPSAGALLSEGVVSAGHLRPLAHLKPAMAAELLPQARGLSVDEFARLVARHRVKTGSKSLAEEQHASRSVTFFEKPSGCISATIAPDIPIFIPIGQALEVMTRADLYAAIRDGTNRATMQFGRNRRYASPLQKLALMLSQRRCIYPACDVAAQRSDVHHLREHERGGLTDLDNEAFLCGPHHTRVHLYNITLIELDDGTWTIGPPAD